MVPWALSTCRSFFDAGKILPVSCKASPACDVSVPFSCDPHENSIRRPCSKQEVASRTPQIIQVVEANKEVVLMQSVAGKHMGRAFHYDKVHKFSRS